MAIKIKSHPLLTQEEQKLVCKYIAEGKPVPPKYKDMLFFKDNPKKTIKHHKIKYLESLPPLKDSSHWQNLLFQGNNHVLMESLKNNPWDLTLKQHGGIQLVYIDPPFTVGTDFFVTIKKDKKNKLLQKAYSDIWKEGIDKFWDMMQMSLSLIHSLLADNGSVYVHCDWRTVAKMRLVLDDIFGEEHFIDEIIWHYTGGGRSKSYFSRKHDTILHYGKSKNWIFNQDEVRIPYKESSGYAKNGIVSASGKLYKPNPNGTPACDVWDIPIINPMSKERTGYPTQKPLALLERIIKASSTADGIVADFFCGSGTTLLAAQNLGRKWIGADLGSTAIAICKKRLFNGSNTPYLLLAQPSLNFIKDKIKLTKKINKKSAAFKLNFVNLTLPKSLPNNYSKLDLTENWQNLVTSWGVGFYNKCSKGNNVFIPIKWEDPKTPITVDSKEITRYYNEHLKSSNPSNSSNNSDSFYDFLSTLEFRVSDIFGQVYICL